VLGKPPEFRIKPCSASYKANDQHNAAGLFLKAELPTTPASTGWNSTLVVFVCRRVEAAQF